MDWQFAITVAIIAAAAVYVLWTMARPLFGRAGKACASGCGKCSTDEPAATPGRIGLPQLPSKMG